MLRGERGGILRGVEALWHLQLIEKHTLSEKFKIGRSRVG